MLKIRTGPPPKKAESAVERLTASTVEAAKMIGVSPGMIAKLTRQGKLTGKKIGRRVLYSIQELRRFIDGDQTERRPL
jgi:excisionase family DNA binding protein